MKNGVQLITYPDSLGGDLKALKKTLDDHFAHVITGVHILPFFPSSGDRGFAPITHEEVEPAFGTWDDIKAISEDYEIMADLMVNHISDQSVYFKDYLQNGPDSQYADYFISNDKFSRRTTVKKDEASPILAATEKFINKLRDHDRVFHKDGVSKSALRKIYRPRPGSPFVKFTFVDGSEEFLWCSFTRHQIDLDLTNPGVMEILEGNIKHMASSGISMIRLDAVGYIYKKRGSSSFMIPEALSLASSLAKTCASYNTVALPEVHGHYCYQLSLLEQDNISYTYDFQIPLLILHSIYTSDAAAFTNWLDLRPPNMITVLDTHDGLPVVDLEDLLSQEQIDSVSEQVKSRGGNEAKRASGGNANNVDTYQINCTYYSALGEDDDAYIIARAMQLFIPGIPQIYYVGLLAGVNDSKLLEETNNGRDINRHNFSSEEIVEEVERPVVKRLLAMMHLRNTLGVFHGDFTWSSASKSQITLLWSLGHGELCEKFEVHIDLEKKLATAAHAKTIPESSITKYTF